RYGGEEFAVVLPETGKRAALKVGQRILEEIEKFRFKSKNEEAIGLITITVGLATFPRDGQTGRVLLESADKALYKGKEMGKNRICTTEECF
ncbi:MAG: GGDEF domain-containing protein, partial [Candidatus Aminicenantes bacterium]|nr:GGDEF domain-containing protein [Candidatus Aminicenantes bacterium]